MNNELAVVSPGELYRQATDVAGVCREIVLKKAVEIQGRKFVPVEAWMAIATAHGCVASSKEVDRVIGNEYMSGGFRATGEIRRMSDGALISTAEGFVGEDEAVWYGGELEVWDKRTRKKVKKVYEKRPDFAIRAMCQTRAISRVCRSAFAHVVVLIASDLDTTPAEETLHHEIESEEARVVTPAEEKQQPNGNGGEKKDWRNYVCSFGKQDGPLRGRQLGELTDANLSFLYGKFISSGIPIQESDKQMTEGLRLWKASGA